MNELNLDLTHQDLRPNKNQTNQTSYLQRAFLIDVEAEGAYFSRFRFHQNMTAPTASASTASSFRFHIPGLQPLLV